MRKLFSPRFVSASLFLSICLLLSLPVLAADHIVQLRHTLWRVTAEGKISAFSPVLDSSGYSGAAGLGDTAPLPSPDGQWVVYVYDSNLDLLDFASGQKRQITSDGEPQKGAYASIDVFITGWSSDSQQILYALAPGIADCLDGCSQDLKIRTKSYGFYSYNLRTKASRHVVLPQDFKFQGWLPDGRFLGVVAKPDIKPCDQELVLIREGQSQGAPSGFPANRWPGQLQLSADGKWAVGHFGTCSNSAEAQILKIDLTSNAYTAVAQPASSAENQRPTFSPNNGHTAYIHRRGTVDGIPQESLIVDGRDVFLCDNHSGKVRFMQYTWVDEQRVALACTGEAIVLDIKSGTVLGRSPVSLK